jgi:hypothetical protein
MNYACNTSAKCRVKSPLQVSVLGSPLGRFAAIRPVRSLFRYRLRGYMLGRRAETQLLLSIYERGEETDEDRSSVRDRAARSRERRNSKSGIIPGRINSPISAIMSRGD